MFGKFTNLVFVRHDMVLVSFGSVLLVSFWTLVLFRYSRILTLWVLGLVLSFLIFSDVVYYRYFGDFVTIPVILQAEQAMDVSGSIVNLLKWQDVFFFLDLLLVIPLLIIWRKTKFKLSWKALNMGGRVSLSIIVACIGFILVYYPISAFKEKNGENLFLNNWWNVSIYNVTGLLGFHYFDTKNFVHDRINKSEPISDEDFEQVQTWFNHHQEQLKSQTVLSGIATDKNILMIQAESFQSFVIGQSVAGKEITPNLNKLIKESSYFNNFYHQVGQARTADAEFIVNNSLFPLPAGSVYRIYPDHDYDSLPTILRDNGYETSVFHAYEKSFWNRHIMYQNYELNYFYGQEDFAPGEMVGWTGKILGDESLLDQAIDHLINGKKPFYAMSVLLSSHHPFTYVPQKYKVLELGQLEGTLEGNYLHAIHYVDHSIGSAIEKLKKAELWEDTVVVIYGDHDAALNLDEKMEALIGIEIDDLAQEEMKYKVPLIIHLPNGSQAGVYPQAVSMIDLAPTLLQIIGIDPSNKLYMGDNLFAKNGQRIPFRYGSFTDGEVFYKASKDGNFKKGTCYDLTTRKETEIGICKPGYEDSNLQLKVSDHVIFHNLLKRLKSIQ